MYLAMKQNIEEQLKSTFTDQTNVSECTESYRQAFVPCPPPRAPVGTTAQRSATGNADDFPTGSRVSVNTHVGEIVTSYIEMFRIPLRRMQKNLM